MWHAPDVLFKEGHPQGSLLRNCKRLDSFLQSCLFACYCALGTFQPQNRHSRRILLLGLPTLRANSQTPAGVCKFPQVMGPASRDVSKLTSVPIFEKRLTSSQPSQLAFLSIFINRLIREYLIWFPPTSVLFIFSQNAPQIEY